jgi:hypothetical protein
MPNHYDYSDRQDSGGRIQNNLRKATNRVQEKTCGLLTMPQNLSIQSKHTIIDTKDSLFFKGAGRCHGCPEKASFHSPGLV